MVVVVMMVVVVLTRAYGMRKDWTEMGDEEEGL